MPEVLRRPDEPARGGWQLDGTVYATEDAYWAARRRRAVRRARWLAIIEAERGEKLTGPGDDEDWTSELGDNSDVDGSCDSGPETLLDDTDLPNTGFVPARPGS